MDQFLKEYLGGGVKMDCKECGKSIPKGRVLSLTCSFNCGRIRRIRLGLNLKRRKESRPVKPHEVTRRMAEKITGFFNNLFAE